MSVCYECQQSTSGRCWRHASQHLLATMERSLGMLVESCIEWHVEESKAGRIGAESVDDVPEFCWLAYMVRGDLEAARAFLAAQSDGLAPDGTMEP